MDENILGRIVQIGTVTDINTGSHKARVLHKDTGITSGWLFVLDNRPAIPNYGVQQETDSRSGGSGESSFEAHTHPLTIKQWMPHIGDTVLCVYLPVWNSDGFVIGGIS